MFVSIGEASVLIGVSVSTLRRWEKFAACQGKLLLLARTS